MLEKKNSSSLQYIYNTIYVQVYVCMYWSKRAFWRVRLGQFGNKKYASLTVTLTDNLHPGKSFYMELQGVVFVPNNDLALGVLSIFSRNWSLSSGKERPGLMSCCYADFSRFRTTGTLDRSLCFNLRPSPGPYFARPCFTIAPGIFRSQVEWSEPSRCFAQIQSYQSLSHGR